MQQNKTTLVQLLITDLQHSASKRGGLILQRSRAHTGWCGVALLSSLVTSVDCYFEEGCDCEVLRLASLYVCIRVGRIGLSHKKLCCRRRTARRAMSVKILSTVETSCTTTTSRTNGVRRLQLVNSRDSSTVV